MALDHNDAKALNAIFAPDQHEFNRGFVYITERAICDRLEAVDPSWFFDIKSIQVRDSDAVVVGSLTVKGVTREGVGMQKVMEKAGEAEKGAATDALKRAARLFGVGRYLLDAPEERQFAAWLAKLSKPNTAPAPAANGWTQQQSDSLFLEAKNGNVTTPELLTMLGVKRISEYEPGFSAARENLRKLIAAKRQTANGAALPDGAL